MNSREILLLLTPIVVGFVVSVIALFSLLFVGFEVDFLIILLILGSPPGVGIVVMFTIAFRLDKQAAQYGIHGISRSLLSVTILFLDMLLEGHADTGNIVEPSPPEEFSRYTSLGFSSTNFALKKIDPESHKIHATLLKEKKQSTASWGGKLVMRFGWFFLVFIFGTLIVVVVLQNFNLLQEDLALIVLYSLSLVGVLVICMFAGHFRRTSQTAPSDELERAILEPDLKTETRLILDRLLGTLFSEGKHPLRVLTIGNYDELNYTDNTYRTSRGIILREAVLIPRHLSI